MPECEEIQEKIDELSEKIEKLAEVLYKLAINDFSEYDMKLLKSIARIG